MVGLLISFVWLGLNLVFGYSFPEAFLNATSFLFWWYTITTSLLFGSCLTTIIFIGAVACRGGGFIGFLFGVVMGIIAGTILSVIALAKNILLIIGSGLLYASVVVSSLELPTWDQTKLIIGSVILLIGIIATKWPSQKSNS